RAIAAGNLAARVPDPPDPELRGLATAFNQMAASLERVEQLRKAVVEDVAHELRTPLTSLQGYTEALADGVIEPTPEMLRTVHGAAVHLGAALSRRPLAHARDGRERDRSRHRAPDRRVAWWLGGCAVGERTNGDLVRASLRGVLILAHRAAKSGGGVAPPPL